MKPWNEVSFVGYDNSEPPQLWAWKGDRDESAEPLFRVNEGALVDRLNALTDRVKYLTEFQSRTLGEPNKLLEPLKRWVGLGETCADGLKRANAEVERLTAERERLLAWVLERIAAMDCACLTGDCDHDRTERCIEWLLRDFAAADAAREGK